MANLQPLATVEQLGIILKVDFEPGDPTAAMLLGWASDLVRTYTGQTISRVENDTVLLTPNLGRIELPEWPVIAVSLVEVEDRYTQGAWSPLDPQEYRLDTAAGRLTGTGSGAYYGYPSWPYHWPVHPQSFRVTYTHGLDVIPDGVAGVTASVAARIHNMPPGIMNERNGQRGATFNTADQVLTAMEKMTLANFREARIA
jgi:hypothetical protein